MEDTEQGGIAGKKLAKATFDYSKTFAGGSGFYMPQQSFDSFTQRFGLSPEKLTIPREWHPVITMCYDFYQRGGSVTTVLNRLAEFAITPIRNGQRRTTNEANNYYSALLSRKPTRLQRFLHMAALEYFLSGLILPNVSWAEMKGRDVSLDLPSNKTYMFPTIDMYPPVLVDIEWAGWGKKSYYLAVPEEDIQLIRGTAKDIKEQQDNKLRYYQQYPDFFNTIKSGATRMEIKDADPILRKEISYSPYPTPYLFNVLESLVFKQQLRRMDFAVASRIINAILLVTEGNDQYPITEETRENLDELKVQIMSRANNPLMMERLFMLFSNHTTKLTWIQPDVTALLDRAKYEQTNEEIYDALGFPKVLITGEGRSGASEIATWAIQPMMEELRSNLLEWMETLYEEAGDLNNFRNLPHAAFKPIRLQDFVKTAAVFQQAFIEGNISRTTRSESVGTDFETETELMKDEQELMKGLPNFPAMPYGAQPQMNTPQGHTGTPGIQGPDNGRPIGSQDSPVVPRSSGVRLGNTVQPTSRVKTVAELGGEALSDGEVINLMDKIAKDRGFVIDLETILDTPEMFND